MGFFALGFVSGLGGDLDLDGDVGGEGDNDRDVETMDLGFLNCFFLSLVFGLLYMGEGDLERGLSLCLTGGGEAFLDLVGCCTGAGTGAGTM